MKNQARRGPRPRERVRPRGKRGARPAADAFRDVVAVLMAGGAGVRFWPLSTPTRPKQFLTELAGRSLYVQAFERARSLVPPARIQVMTGAGFLDFVREQTPGVPRGNVILEPLRRDTAAAAILAALVVARRRPDGIMIVLPSDHFVGDAAEFRQTMAAAVARARRGGLGTVGIRPTRPATDFGYLQLADPPMPRRPQRVERFVEKPRRRKAEQYVASGTYLWNSGIFVWQARELLRAAEQHLPGTYRALAGLADAVTAKDFPRRARKAFSRIRPISVDYGIMEKADDVWCVPGAFEWDDVGGWLAAERLMPADARGNRIRGRVFLDEVAGTLVLGQPDHPIAVAGLTDCIIVHSEAGSLVCHKSAVERIKPLIQRLLEG